MLLALNLVPGVSSDVLACCDEFLCVPQARLKASREALRQVRGASLNVAHAAAICMYQLLGSTSVLTSHLRLGRPKKVRAAASCLI